MARHAMCHIESGLWFTRHSCSMNYIVADKLPYDEIDQLIKKQIAMSAWITAKWLSSCTHGACVDMCNLCSTCWSLHGVCRERRDRNLIKVVTLLRLILQHHLLLLLRIIHFCEFVFVFDQKRKEWLIHFAYHNSLTTMNPNLYYAQTKGIGIDVQILRNNVNKIRIESNVKCVFECHNLMWKVNEPDPTAQPLQQQQRRLCKCFCMNALLTDND